MNTNNTPNGAEGGPPANSFNVRGHAAADTDTAAPSQSTAHAPSSTHTNYNNPSAVNSEIQDVKPAAVESTPASASKENVEPEEGGASGSGDISEMIASLPQPSRLEPPRPFNVADYDEAEDAKLKNKAKQTMAMDASSDLSEMVASLPQPILPKPPLPFNIADYDEGEDAELKNMAKQAMAMDASSDLSEMVASLPQPIRPKPPLPFNVADYDEGEDAELKNQAKQVGASSKHKDSIIVPTEEDIADGAALDPATSRERRIRGDEGEAVDLELGGMVEPSQLEDEESEESSQADVAPFNNELPVLEAYIVEEESKRDVVIATQLELPPPSLPWWKQRRTKLLLGTVLVVFAAMAIALGVSMSSSSSVGEPTVVMFEKTSSPSNSLVPSSIPSVSLRPSVHPSLSPTTTPSQYPTFTPSQTPSQSPTFTRLVSLKFVPDDGAEYHYFGERVAIFEDTLVVCETGDDDKGGSSGSAYIYHLDPQTKEWILQQKLVPDDGDAGGVFGWSVDIHNGTVVVGASGDDTEKGTDSGSVYIYNRDPETKEWRLQQKIEPDDGTAVDSFGYSVGIYGNSVVVGAWGDNVKGENIGSAYIYQQDFETNEWILQQKLVPDDGAADDGFGGSVAIYQDTVVVGASGDDDKGDWSGSAYIYHLDPETKELIFQQKLVPDDGAAYDYFGESVAVFGDTIVVGAVLDDDKGDDSGSAYIYQQDPETKEWILQQKLVADDGAAYAYFGWSVAIYDGTVIVGATGDTDKGYSSGSAYIYHKDLQTKEWILQQKLVADDGSREDGFGGSVAIYQDTVVVGADGDDDKGDSSGSVYVYSSSFTRAPSPMPTQTPSMMPSTTLNPSAIPTQTPSLVPTTTLNPSAMPTKSAMPTQSSKPSTSSSPTETCYWITIAVVYNDGYPDETSWEIVSIGSNGTEVVVKSYEEVDWVATSHAEDVCLPEGEYDFVIFDSYRDGICCEHGKGNYKVTTWDGEMISKGGKFAAEERTRFSIPFTPVQPSPT